MSDTVAPEGVPTDDERAREVREQLKSVHAFDLAYEMMVGLVSFGYQKMGLTDETHSLRDLADARLSIELLRATLGVIERELGEERTRDLHGTLAQMQLSYAQAVQSSGSAAAGSAGAAGEPAAETVAPVEEAPEETPPARKKAARKPAAKKRAVKKPAAEDPPRGTPDDS